MSATNRDDGIAKPDAEVGAQASNDKGVLEDIDPDQPPLRPAVAHPQVKEVSTDKAKEGEAPRPPGDVAPDQNGTGAA